MLNCTLADSTVTLSLRVLANCYVVQHLSCNNSVTVQLAAAL